MKISLFCVFIIIHYAVYFDEIFFLGYYLGTVCYHLENKDKPENSYSEKVIKQLEKVKELVDAFPRTNSEDHDILGLAENIRAQYKKTCALLKVSSGNPYGTGVSF